MSKRTLMWLAGLVGAAVIAANLLVQKEESSEPEQAAATKSQSPPAEAYQQPELPISGSTGHEHHEHHHPGMSMDLQGAVMGENKDRLPQDCPEIAGDVKLTVHAGRKYADRFPGLMFAYDHPEWNVEPCSRVTVTFINDDDIRHQWMLHGLPKYIYPQGMFHIEVTGPGEKTGTFILPSLKRTYFVHCDMAQHTEKGLKAQLKAGGGDMDLPSIPGITATINADTYAVEWGSGSIGMVLIAGIAGALVALFGLDRLRGRDAKNADSLPGAQG